jgi:DNA-directed RNA polymerase specialized sigma24 family protein
MQAMGIDRLRALLWELRADDRRLLECRIVDGWRYADIAVHLGVPRSVLADRVHRLRTDLRRKAKALRA